MRFMDRRFVAVTLTKRRLGRVIFAKFDRKRVNTTVPNGLHNKVSAFSVNPFEIFS